MRSARFTPQARTRTSTWSPLGSGVATSRSSRTSGPPGLVMTMAFMASLAGPGAPLPGGALVPVDLDVVGRPAAGHDVGPAVAVEVEQLEVVGGVQRVVGDVHGAGARGRVGGGRVDPD